MWINYYNPQPWLLITRSTRFISLKVYKILSLFIIILGKKPLACDQKQNRRPELVLPLRQLTIRFTLL